MCHCNRCHCKRGALYEHPIRKWTDFDPDWFPTYRRRLPLRTLFRFFRVSPIPNSVLMRASVTVFPPDFPDSDGSFLLFPPPFHIRLSERASERTTNVGGHYTPMINRFRLNDSGSPFASVRPSVRVHVRHICTTFIVKLGDTESGSVSLSFHLLC